MSQSDPAARAPEAPSSGGGDPRSGYVTLLGRPNAGKSTLLNSLVGERLSIVSPRAQTTWQRVTGILTTGRAQMVFLDTPGLLQPRDLLQRSMLSVALSALREADVVLLVLDATTRLSGPEREGLAALLEDRPAAAPLLCALNKVDVAHASAVKTLAGWVTGDLRGEACPISALRGSGVAELRDRIEESLPTGPFLYPPDEIAKDPIRFFAAEMIRETVFHRYRQEIPYSVFCRIEEFREEQDPIYVQAHLFVERESQKRILIGKGGSSIRELGREARSKLEDLLQRRVYLDLWIKVLPDWRRKRGHLRRLGFPLPDADHEQRGG